MHTHYHSIRRPRTDDTRWSWSPCPDLGQHNSRSLQKQFPLVRSTIHMLRICFRDSVIFGRFLFTFWARGGAVCSGCALQAGQSRGSIPDGVTGIFHWHNPSGRTMTLRSTQPLAEMSTRNFSEIKSGRYVRKADNITTLMCWLFWNLGASTSWNPQGLNKP
jgi:hypothetical protein